MFYQQPSGVPPSGQDPGSGIAMQVMMALLAKKPQEPEDYSYKPDPENPSTFGGAIDPQTGQYAYGFTGLDPQTGRYSYGFTGLDPQTGRYATNPGMSYNTSAYGPLGVKTDNAY